MFAFLVTVVFIAVAVVQAQNTLPANCARSATVASGDTCNGISAWYKVSSYQLAAVNAGIINPDCTNLYVGELICLGINGQDCKDTYVSQEGDTCTEIASKSNIPEGTLFANNPNLNNPSCTNLYPGEVLCVSSTIYPYSSSGSL